MFFLLPGGYSFSSSFLQVVDTRTTLQNATRYIYEQPAYTGIRNVIESVYKEGGVRALYRGVGKYLLFMLFLNLCHILCYCVVVDFSCALLK